jgi:hypothetical protein
MEKEFMYTSYAVVNKRLDRERRETTRTTRNPTVFHVVRVSFVRFVFQSPLTA